MDKSEKKLNNTAIIAIIAVIAILIIVALVFAFTSKGSNNEKNQNVSSAEQLQSDNNNNLAKVQEKIDAQEKVINDLNEKLTPLVEERTKLEEQLMELTNSEVAPAQDVAPEEKPEEPAEVTENITE